jgi:hypothetical protein
MIESMIFVTQTYLAFATARTLERAAAQARLSIVLHSGEELHPKLVPYITEIYRLTGGIRTSLLPSFEVDELTAIARREIDARGGDPGKVVLFCQQEDNVLPTAHVRRRTGIRGDGPELVRRFRDKVVMKEALAGRLPGALPRYRKLCLPRIVADPVGYYDELAAGLGTDKLVVKPTFGAASLDVTVVTSPSDLVLALRKIHDNGREYEYEVDEFLSGTMHQCDSFIRHGKVVFSGILQLGCSNFDFVQGKPLSVYPVTDKETYDRLFDFNQKVITALEFRDGSTHHELFLSRGSDGRLTLKFLEIAARAAGGLAIPFHELNYGVNLIDACIWLALEDDAADDLTIEPRNNVVSALLPVGNGTIVSLNEPDIVSKYSIDWRVRVGDVVSSRSLVDSAGILTLLNDDPAILRRDFESLQSYVPVICR